MRWLLALLALVLPPVALAGGGSAVARFGPVLLWLVAVGVFFGLAWGAGVVLAALAGVLAAILVVRQKRVRA